MAVPWSRSLLLFTGISMLSFLNCFFSLVHSNGDLIWEVCSATTNPPLCLRSFKEDPPSPTADLKTLVQISLDFSTSTAKSSRQIVKSLRQNATEDRMVGIFDTCLETKGYGINRLSYCSEYLNSGALSRPKHWTCNNSFKEAECSEPQQLKDAAKLM